MISVFNSFIVLGALVLTGCAGVSTQNRVDENISTETAVESHFVKVVLPADEKSRGAEVILSLEGREPMIESISPDIVIDPEMPPSVHFLVGETVAPATLEIKYLSGETKKLNKVIFDTTLTLSS